MAGEEKVEKSNILMYTTEDGVTKVEVTFDNDTVWLSLDQIADLFQRNKSTISRHIKNIFLEGELSRNSVVANFATTGSDGKRYHVDFYNLDVIISVGYRVKSLRGTQFRIWATKTLKEYITKGFVLNDEMLKNGRPFGKDYFDELLERIREIRASERRFYQKITDIYATSYDYYLTAPQTKEFFSTVQNKLLFAITGQTAPELISSRADSKKDHMGLTTWKNAPEGKILKSDVKISKNYLNDNELSELNRIVSMYLDYAENQAKRQNLMSMDDWADKLDAFLQFNEYELLDNAGIVKRAVADKLAEEEYEKYRVIQDESFQSDFDKETKKLLEDR